MKTLRRRRAENKTDYKARLAMLKSEKPRLVARKTNKYLVAQVTTTDLAQDKPNLTVSSKDLLGVGWPKDKSGSLKSLQAAYLTGLLLAKKSEIKEAILDIGLQRNIHKARLYALVKGAIDGGLKVSASQDALPSDQDLSKNEDLKKTFEEVKKKI